MAPHSAPDGVMWIRGWGDGVQRGASREGDRQKQKYRAPRDLVGRISAARDAITGAFQIEPSELHRAFAPAAAESHDTRHDASDGAIQVAVSEARLSEKEALIAVHERTIDDLRRQRDAEAEERRRLTMLLADRSTAPAIPAAPQPASDAPRRRWWQLRS